MPTLEKQKLVEAHLSKEVRGSNRRSEGLAIAREGSQDMPPAAGSPAPGAQDKKVRMTLEFSSRFNDTVEKLMEELDLNSKTDVLKRSVALLAFVSEKKKKNQDLAIVDEKGQIVNLISLI